MTATDLLERARRAGFALSALPLAAGASQTIDNGTLIATGDLITELADEVVRLRALLHGATS